MPSFFFTRLKKKMICSFRLLLGVVALTLACASVAQPRVYRCDNATYTNQPEPTQRCTPMTGGAVTVIEGTRVNGASPTSGLATHANASVKVETQEQQQEQKQRDAHAVTVLQTELQKAQARHLDLLKQWNQGVPERMADEYKQPAKYQERVTQLRAALQRSEADVMGLQRELARWVPGGVAGVKP